MKEVTIQQLQVAIEDGAYVLDVREPGEYVEGHVPGAVSMPLGEVAARASELPDDVWVICRSGRRSITGGEAIIASGRNAVSVAGGTLAWVAAGLPVVTGTEPN